MRYSVLLVLVLLFACGDTSNNSGCTDLYAYNYDEFATYDDGSCLYIACTDQNAINYGLLSEYDITNCHYLADVTFYLDVSGANYFDGLGVQFLDIYIEGSYVGTLLGNLGFSFIPPCDPPDSDAVNFSIEWQNNTANPNTTFSWQVRDGSDGFIYYDGTDLVSANDCLTLGLSAKKIQEYLNSK